MLSLCCLPGMATVCIICLLAGGRMLLLLLLLSGVSGVRGRW